MTPRDWSIVFDNDLIIGNTSKDVAKRFAIGVAEHAEYFKRPKELLGFNPASIIRLGKDIIVDVQNNSNTESMVNYIKNTYEPLGYTIHGGKTFNVKFKNPMTHGDAVFAILKPGVILTTHPKNLYNNSIFKGWDVHIIENSKERSIFKDGWMQDKAKQRKDGTKTIKLDNGKTQSWSTNYSFDDKKFNNEEFTLYINKWFNNWVGYSSESIFDVNCLVLDESHVVFTNYNKGVWDFCKKHNIEPIICNFRHRWFWDGGLHCITVDIEREGPCEQYL